MKMYRYFVSMLLMLALFAPAYSATSNYGRFNDTVTIGGVPLVNSHSGDVFWVDSNGGGGSKGTFSRPCLTVDACVNLTTANNGDIVFVKAGHGETLSGADGIDADVAGIAIVGLGTGTDTPEFTYSAVGSELVIGAANVTIHNLRLLAGISDVVTAISVETAAANATISGIYFPEPTTAGFEFLDAIDLAGATDGVTIRDCTFYNIDGTGGNHFIEAGNGINSDMKIINNNVWGEFSVAAIWSDTADLQTLIEGGSYTNATSGQYAIEFTAAATGHIRDVLVRTDTQTAGVDPGSMTTSNVLWDDESTADTVAIPVVAASAGPIGTVDSTTTDSINGKIGTDTEMADSSLSDVLWAGAGIAAFPSAAAPANGVSLAEVIRNVAQASGPSAVHENYITVTADLTSATWNTAAAHEIAAVTGAVRMQILVEVTGTAVTTGNTGTMALGYAGNVSSIFSATGLDSGGTTFTAGDVVTAVYGSAATTPVGGADATSSLTSALFDVVVVNGIDVGYTIATNAATSGTVIFHIWWVPLDATGAVTAGAGGAF